jgi:hypothetical protein
MRHPKQVIEHLELMASRQARKPRRCLRDQRGCLVSPALFREILIIIM